MAQSGATVARVCMLRVKLFERALEVAREGWHAGVDALSECHKLVFINRATGILVKGIEAN